MARGFRGMSTGTMVSFRAAAKRIARATRNLGELLPEGLLMIGEEIMADVKDSRPGHGVPVDKGTLRGSGRVELQGGVKPRVILSFGGAAAPYALIQHEITTYRHTVGEPRYLVRGIERWNPGRSGAFTRLKRRAQRAVGGP